MATRDIHGRRAVDRASAAEIAGVAVPTIDYLYRERARTGFPDRADGAWWYEDDVRSWTPAHDRTKKAALTEVDRSGDADDLLNAAQAARVLGYVDRTSLCNSSVWPKLLDRVDDEHILPSGRVRRQWRRRTVWTIADERTGKGIGAGRPVGTSRSGLVDRGGKPRDLVDSTEAARVLGYAKADLLPAALLDQADETTDHGAGRQRRRWYRRTLWQFADQHLADR
jgi:hypothetical protein